jgi:hypothetical protein
MFVTRRFIAQATMPIIGGVVSVLFAISQANAAETITVCSAKGTEASKGDLLQLSRLLALPAEVIDAGNDSVALTRDEQGFDLILNWHQQNEHSLRADSVDILGTELGSLIHLMAARQGSIEHYLFNLDEEGSGDLLWDAGASQRGKDTSASFACTKPR